MKRCHDRDLARPGSVAASSGKGGTISPVTRGPVSLIAGSRQGSACVRWRLAGLRPLRGSAITKRQFSTTFGQISRSHLSYRTGVRPTEDGQLPLSDRRQSLVRRLHSVAQPFGQTKAIPKTLFARQLMLNFETCVNCTSAAICGFCRFRAPPKVWRTTAVDGRSLLHDSDSDASCSGRHTDT
jgi:hypothetical protein